MLDSLNETRVAPFTLPPWINIQFKIEHQSKQEQYMINNNDNDDDNNHNNDDNSHEHNTNMNNNNTWKLQRNKWILDLLFPLKTQPNNYNLNQFCYSFLYYYVIPCSIYIMISTVTMHTHTHSPIYCILYIIYIEKSNRRNEGRIMRRWNTKKQFNASILTHTHTHVEQKSEKLWSIRIIYIYIRSCIIWNKHDREWARIVMEWRERGREHVSKHIHVLGCSCSHLYTLVMAQYTLRTIVMYERYSVKKY